MRKPLILIVAALLPSWSLSLGQSSGTDTVRVGPLGSPRQLVFEGNQRHSADAIRESLRLNAHFLKASHPMAPLPDYLDTLEQVIGKGYRLDGHRDVTVDVQFKADTGQVHIHLTEGPRFVWGRLEINGLPDDQKATLLEILTKDPETFGSEIRRYKKEVASLGKLAEAEHQRLADETGELQPQWQGVGWTSPIWQKGAPVNFTNKAAEQLENNIGNAFAYLGHFSPLFTTQTVIDETTRRVAMQIDTTTLGSLLTKPKIRVEGNFEHTADEILDYLDLPETFTGTVYDEIELKLWRSGRFADFCLFFPVLPQDDEPGTIRLLVREMPGTPRLDESLTLAQRTLLKASRWLTHFRAENEPLNLQLDAQEEGFAMIHIHPGPGLHFQFRGDVANQPVRLEAWYGERNISLDWKAAADAGQVNFPFAADGLTAYLTFTPTDGTDDKNVSLQMGATMNSTRNEVPIDLILAPASILHLFSRLSDLEAAEEGEAVRLTSAESHLNLLIDQDTGRPLSFEAGPKEQRFRGNTTELSTDSAKPAWASKPEHQSVLSGLRFIRKVLEIYGGRKDDKERLQVIELFANGLAPLYEAWKEDYTTKDATFPSWDSLALESASSEVVVQNVSKRLVANMVYSAAERILPERSWLWTVARETHATLAGLGNYRQEVVEVLGKGETLGPVGCLTVAALLQRESVFPLEGLHFARLTRERLNAKAFRQDWEAFLTEPSRLQDAFLIVLKDLSQFDDDSLQILTKSNVDLQKAVKGFQDSYPQIIADGKITPDELSPLMNALWAHRFRELVSEHLDSILTQLPDPDRKRAKVGDWTITEAEVLFLARRQRGLTNGQAEDPLTTIILRESVLALPDFKEKASEWFEEAHKEIQANPDAWAKYRTDAKLLARAMVRDHCHDFIKGIVDEKLETPEIEAEFRKRYDEEEDKDALLPFEEMKPLFLRNMKQKALEEFYRDAVKAAKISHYDGE